MALKNYLFQLLTVACYEAIVRPIDKVTIILIVNFNNSLLVPKRFQDFFFIPLTKLRFR